MNKFMIGDRVISNTPDEPEVTGLIGYVGEITPEGRYRVYFEKPAYPWRGTAPGGYDYLLFEGDELVLYHG